MISSPIEISFNIILANFNASTKPNSAIIEMKYQKNWIIYFKITRSLSCNFSYLRNFQEFSMHVLNKPPDHKSVIEKQPLTPKIKQIFLSGLAPPARFPP